MDCCNLCGRPMIALNRIREGTSDTECLFHVMMSTEARKLFIFEFKDPDGYHHLRNAAYLNCRYWEDAYKDLVAFAKTEEAYKNFQSRLRDLTAQRDIDGDTDKFRESLIGLLTGGNVESRPSPWVVVEKNIEA